MCLVNHCDRATVYNGRNPLVTVITVSLNQSENLEETINSVLAQTYQHIEYIVVDGGSNDGTKQVIQKYSKKITTWLSEPDKGIYDAMNKGVALGVGEWVIFMNAGDCFADDQVVQNIFNSSTKQADFIYGHHKVLYEDGFEGTCFAGDVCDLWKGMAFSHQAVFVRADLLKSNPFCTTEPIGADFEMIFNAYISHVNFLKSNVVIAKIKNGGLSDVQRVRSLISHWRIVRKYRNGFRIKIFYVLSVIDIFARQWVKKILPSTLISQIIKLKYQFRHMN